MPAIKYIFLGIVQGLTEFLPVSSSAHLVIVQDFLQIQENQILLNIVLHLGTLAALVVFLYNDIKQMLNRRICLLILLATACTAIIALTGHDIFIRMFYAPQKVVLPLLITGLVLLSTKRLTQPLRARAGLTQPIQAGVKRSSRSMLELKIADAVYLGIVQGLAVIPGLSRSGLTISTLLVRGVQRETAFKFSFLASILAILGALFFKISDFSLVSLGELRYIIFGFLASFFSGLLALKMLLAVIRRARLYLFGYYCVALSSILWIYYK